MSGGNCRGGYAAVCDGGWGEFRGCAYGLRLNILRRRRRFRLPAPGFPASGASPLAHLRASSHELGWISWQVRYDLNQVVNSASGRYRLDPDLVNSVIKAESGFNVRAVSPKGAQGLMQLMPGTASQLGVPNAFDPQANVEGGTKYLRELLERYNFDLVKALAAYNAGPQRVEQFGGVPPYYETRAYVARIVRDFNKKKAAQEKLLPPAKRRGSKNSAVRATRAAKAGSGSRLRQRPVAPSE